MASRFSIFLAELRRRNVGRVAAVYAGVGTAIAVAVPDVFATMLIPDWAARLVILLIILGFPVALVLAWALELKPGGIQRTPDLSPEEIHDRAGPGVASLLGFGVAAAFVLAGVGYWIAVRQGVDADGTPLRQDRVVVFPFENLTGDQVFDDLGEAAAHWITDGLSRTAEVRAVPTSAVLQAVQAYREEALHLDIASSLQAGIMVTGVITRREEDLELQAQLTDVGTREILVSVQGSGGVSDPMMAADAVRGRLMSALSLQLGETDWGRLVSRPPKYEALQAFQRGQKIFMTTGQRAAIPYLDEAYRLDTTFAAPITLLGAGYGNMGRWAEADSVLAILKPRRHQLSRFDALYLEYLLARNAGDNRARLNAARALSEIDTYVAGYTHANAAMFEGRPREALEALTRTDPDDPLWREWGGYWNRLCQAHFYLGQSERALETARKYRERFPESLLARQYEISALIGLGRLDEIPALLEEVDRMQPAQSYSPGSVRRELAVMLMRFKHSDRSLQMAEHALEWYQSQDPDTYAAATALALFLAGRLDEALPLQQALAAEDSESILHHGRLGVFLALSGDTAGAEAQHRWLAELDRPYLHGANDYWRAAILAHLDRKDEALQVLRQALGEGVSYSGRLSDEWLMPLWFYEPFEQLVGPRG